MVTRHDKARADYRRGGRGDVHKPRRTKAWRDREAQPEESAGTLRKDMLERPLWLAPQEAGWAGTGGSPALLHVRERSGIMACRGAAGGGVYRA